MTCEGNSFMYYEEIICDSNVLYQILMSVPMVLITVTLMLFVLTLLVVSLVPVTKATLEMDSPVK